LRRGCGAQLEWRVLHPRGVARGHPRRHGARVRPRHRAPGRPGGAPRHWTAPHLQPRSGWLVQGLWRSARVGGCCTPRCPARSHPRRHGACVPPRPRAPGRPGAAPRHWTAPHLQSRGGWLAQGLWRSARVAGAAPPVTWRAATRADTGPVCRLGARSPWRSTSTLDRTTPPVSRWLACTGAVALSSSGGRCTPVAWRVATRADTVPVCRLGDRSHWRSTSTLDSTTPPVSRWLACTGGVQLEWPVLHPRGVARGHPRRHGARVPSRRPVALAEHLDTGQHHTSSLEVVGLHRGCGAELEWAGAAPPVAWRVATRADTVPVCRLGLGRPVALAQHLDTGPHHTSSLEGVGLRRGCGAQLEWRVLHPPWRGARPPAPTRCPRATSAPGRPGGAPRHWTAPHLQSRGGWLAQGLWRSARVAGAAPPVAWRAATRADKVPVCRLGARSPWRSTSTLDSTTPPASR